MSLDFEWDPGKARDNFRKHGVSFEEASTIFADTFSFTITDPDHSFPDEERFTTIGMSYQQRLLVVAHCDRGENVRIINARRATRRERKDYENT